MKTTIHRADSRGVAKHGWLHSRHTFSFAGYYDPNRMGFGKLRVINDDIVDGGAGFGTHPHDNMEIISIPLHGSLHHQDSMGNQHIINAGDVQIMSAGTGLTHSEYNGSDTEPVNFLQIWVYPKFRNIKPRYGQVTLDPELQRNQFAVVVSPNEQANAVTINQDAWFAMGEFEAGSSARYESKQTGNGIYLFVIEGEVSVDTETLQKRDAMAISNSDAVNIEINKPGKLLAIEVPINNQ
jgi:redox-sensitive bicupin YhaK (pirin superfamily)